MGKNSFDNLLVTLPLHFHIEMQNNDIRSFKKGAICLVRSPNSKHVDKFCFVYKVHKKGGIGVVIDSFRKITYSTKGLRVLRYEDAVVRRRRGEWFDICTARDEFFAPEDEENERSLLEETSTAGGIQRRREEEEEGIVLHEDGETHSAPSSSVSNPPPRRRQVRRDDEGDSGLVDSIDRLSRVIETILIKMDRINNRLDLLEAHVDAANDARLGHAGREVQIFQEEGQPNGSGGASGANSISEGSSMMME